MSKIIVNFFGLINLFIFLDMYVNIDNKVIKSLLKTETSVQLYLFFALLFSLSILLFDIKSKKTLLIFSLPFATHMLAIIHFVIINNLVLVSIPYFLLAINVLFVEWEKGRDITSGILIMSIGVLSFINPTNTFEVISNVLNVNIKTIPLLIFIGGFIYLLTSILNKQDIILTLLLTSPFAFVTYYLLERSFSNQSSFSIAFAYLFASFSVVLLSFQNEVRKYRNE